MDLYAVLGLAPGASSADIKRAYRRLSRRYHPGINPGDRAAEALFRRITEAYETLTDPARRQQYDAGGKAPANSPARCSRSSSPGSISRSRRTARRRRRSPSCSPKCCIRSDRRTRGRPEAGRGSARHADRDVPGIDERGAAAGGGDAAGCLSRVPGHRQRGDAGRALSALPCDRARAMGARAHGVLEVVRGVRRDRPAAASAVRRRAARTGAWCRTEGIVGQRAAGDVRRHAAADRGEGARRPSWRKDRRSLRRWCTSPRTRCSAARGTICTSRCRSRCTRRCWRADRGAVARWSVQAHAAAGHAGRADVPRERPRRADAGRRHAAI